MPQCAAHDTFERLWQQSIDNLSANIKTGIESLNKQSSENGAALTLVLRNQADRRELCGKQGARIDGAEVDIVNLWKTVSALRKLVYMAAGGLLVVQFILTVAASVAVKFISG